MHILIFMGVFFPPLYPHCFLVPSLTSEPWSCRGPGADGQHERLRAGAATKVFSSEMVRWGWNPYPLVMTNIAIESHSFNG